MLYPCLRVLAFFGCAVIAIAGDVHGQMAIRDVPLNETAAWKSRAAQLQSQTPTTPVPPLRVPGVVMPGPFFAPFAGAALVPGTVPPEWRDRIRRASGRHGVEEALLAAVLKAESDFNPLAVSPKGAQGAMQIMPATGRELGLRDVFDPEANLDAGAAYLAAQLRAFPSLELALAAYNAGPEAVRRHKGLPPYDETRAYVAQVLALFRQYRATLR